MFRKQLEEGIDPSLLTKAEARIADRYLIIRNVRNRLIITLNDKAILKTTRLYGYFVLVLSLHAVVGRKYGKGKTFWSIYRIEAAD